VCLKVLHNTSLAAIMSGFSDMLASQVSNEDGRKFVQNLLARDPPLFFSQVVMNLPLDAAEFLGNYLPQL
jgi:hypothetical protein